MTKKPRDLRKDFEKAKDFCDMTTEDWGNQFPGIYDLLTDLESHVANASPNELRRMFTISIRNYLNFQTDSFRDLL